MAVVASGRHFPRRFESAEVIDANAIDQRQQRAEALDPPGVSGLRERVPAVVRIAPELAGGAEVVGRHAGRRTVGWPSASRRNSSRRAQTSALSCATKIGRSPMIWIDRARQASRTRCHCSKNRNCVSLCSRISRAQRADQRAIADWIALRDVGLPRRPGGLVRARP